MCGHARAGSQRSLSNTQRRVGFSYPWAITTALSTAYRGAHMWCAIGGKGERRERRERRKEKEGGREEIEMRAKKERSRPLGLLGGSHGL